MENPVALGAFMHQLSARIWLPDWLQGAGTCFRLFSLRRAGIAMVLPLALLLSACSSFDKNGGTPGEPLPLKSGASGPQNKIRFAVAGDIMAHDSQLQAAYDNGCECYDFRPVFATAAPLFKNVDIAIANLETTLPGKNYSGYPAFGAPDSLVDAAKSAGINVLTTANNHCLDKGKDALIRTLHVLDEKGISHLGTYASGQDYANQRIFLLNKNGMTVAMLDYTYGTNNIPTPDGVVVNRISKNQISADIALAREKQHADAVIVLFHFGKEYLNTPDAFQREMVLHALASGADIVLGGHPHRVQPYEVLHDAGPGKPHLVAYSLGNFVSAQRDRYSDGGMVLYFTLVKKRDTGGTTAIDITDVHHEFVWVYIKHDGNRKQFHILPIETFLQPGGDTQLPQSAIDGMKRYRDDVNEVLGVKEGSVPSEP
jgi:poly-gamma-glutamate capsule biosynthesis protein CapA/YwtB (metallophosphatase superfamily)